MSMHYNIAGERSRPVLNEAGCQQWLLDCVDATDDGWQQVGRTTRMCELFAPFRCDGLFARQAKGEGPIADIARFEVKAWQLVMLLGIGWLVLCGMHRRVRRTVGRDTVDKSNSSVDSGDKGPLRTPSAVQPRCHDSAFPAQADPRLVSPPTLASRSAPHSLVPPLNPHEISLQLGEDEIIQESPVKWSFGDLASGSGKAVAEIIAGGSFAQVGRIRRANGTHLAVKEMATWHPSLESHTEEYIQRELRMLQECSIHPNVVDTLGWIKTSRRVLLMMPLVPTNVHAMIEVEPLNDDVARALIRQLVSALDFMHIRRIAHRDVKPANLLVATDMTLLLADFGVADRVPRGGYFADVVGTESYMAPEILNNNEDTRQYSVLVDMWATGVVANEMLTGTTPFRPGRTEAGVSTDLDADAIERANIRNGRGFFELALEGTPSLDFVLQVKQ